MPPPPLPKLKLARAPRGAAKAISSSSSRQKGKQPASAKENSYVRLHASDRKYLQRTSQFQYGLTKYPELVSIEEFEKNPSPNFTERLVLLNHVQGKSPGYTHEQLRSFLTYRRSRRKSGDSVEEVQQGDDEPDGEDELADDDDDEPSPRVDVPEPSTSQSVETGTPILRLLKTDAAIALRDSMYEIGVVEAARDEKMEQERESFVYEPQFLLSALFQIGICLLSRSHCYQYCGLLWPHFSL